MAAADNTKRPCRTTLQLDGLEWFVYNRSAAFDDLLTKLGHREKEDEGTTSTLDHKLSNAGTIHPPTGEPHMRRSRGAEVTEDTSIDWFRESLPIEVHVNRGSVVLGNRSTPSLLIAGFKSAVGTCGAVDSRSRFDLYKQVYQFSFAKPRIVFRKNHDYEGPMIQHGERMQKTKEDIT